MKLSFLSVAIILITQCSFAQWEPDVRLTYDPFGSHTAPSNGAHAIAASGDSIHIVWFDNRDGNDEIYYKQSVDGGETWETDIRLTDNPFQSRYPSIAFSGSMVHVAWLEESIMEIFYKRSTDGGNTWGDTIRLTNTSGNTFHPCITTSGSTIHVVYYTQFDGWWEVFYRRSIDNGLTWEQEVRLTNDPFTSIRPSIIANGAVLYVSWHDRRDGNSEIYYKQSLDTGLSWSSDIRLTYNSDTSWGSCVAVSQSGIHIVWSDTRDGNSEIYYKRSIDGGNSWEPDVRLTNSYGVSDYPNLSSTGGTGLFLVWTDRRDGNNEIYYKLSTNEGLAWGPDIRLTENSSESVHPFVAVSGAEVHVTWYDDRDGNNEIYYKRDPTAGVLLADFEADPMSLCVGESAQFTDLSTWNPTQWQWTFPGGTPGTSTQQNPIIFYNTPGSYDVTLFASNGSSSDIITKSAYISVFPVTLVAPATPEGDDELCMNSQNTEYNTTGSSGASGYTWQIDPTSAGVIYGAGFTATVDWDDSFVGNASISVMATNICTQSDYSDPLTVTIYPTPVAYNLMGGGSFCQGEDGVEIGMENSQIGVEYELLNQGVPAGSIIMGTGSGISFGTFSNSGTYTAIGRDTASWCENEMSNNVSVTLIPTPFAFQVTGGGPYCDGSNGKSINLSGSQGDHTYELYLEGQPTGITLQGTGGTISFQDITTSGTYTILGTENSMLCTNLMQDSAEVWIIYDPPMVPASPDGPDSVNVFFTPTSEYTTDGSYGAITYEWSLEPDYAGTTTLQDTMIVMVTWNPSFLGIADLLTRGVNDCGPGEWSDPLAIYVENTVGLEEIDKTASVFIYPNPNDGSFTLTFLNWRTESFKVLVINTLGQIIYSDIKKDVQGNASIPVNINNCPPGIYFLQVEDKSGISNHKLIIRKE